MRIKTIIIIGVLAAVTLIFMYPALPVLGSAVIGDGGDNYQFLGFQYLAHRLLSEGHFELGHTIYWRYPIGFDLQSGTDSMLFIATGLVFYSFTVNPVLVYNLSVLVLVFLNLVFSYLAFRTWFNRTLSVVGGIIYGLSFYSLAKVGGHVNLISTAGFALFFAAVYRIWRDDGRPRDFAMMAASVAYLMLSSLQYPLLLIGALPFLIALLVIIARPNLVRLFQILWRQKILFVASAGLAILLVFPLEGRKIIEFLRGETVLPADRFISVPAINLVVPNRYIPTVASLLAAERLPFHFYLSPAHREEDLVAAVRARPTRAVLDLPAYASWWKGQRYDLYSVYYDRPIVEGYFHWSGDRPSSRILTDRLNEFRCYLEPEPVIHYDAALAKRKHDEILDALVKYDIRIVVVHWDLFGSPSQCGAAPQFVDALLEDKERWEVLLDIPNKRVLWLKP